MTDIFISYASEDRSRTETFAKALESKGWSVWWDRKIPPGKTFDQVIHEAISAARCVIVLWSTASIKSEFVREEANFAKQKNILIPVLLEPVGLPFGFTLIEAADLSDWKAEQSHPEYIELLKAIESLLGTSLIKTEKEVEKEPPPVEIEDKTKRPSQDNRKEDTLAPSPTGTKNKKSRTAFSSLLSYFVKIIVALTLLSGLTYYFWFKGSGGGPPATPQTKRQENISPDPRENSIEEREPITSQQPVDKSRSALAPGQSLLGDMGLSIQDLTPELVQQYGYSLNQGVLISSVEVDSPASSAGLQAGHLIEDVNNQEVHNLKELQKVLVAPDYPNKVLLRVRTGEYSYYVVVQTE